MEENQTPGQRMYQEPATTGSSESLDDSSLVSSFASLPQSTYQVDNMLEVHDQGVVQPQVAPSKTSVRRAIGSFSRRKALIVSVAITVAVTLFTGASALLLGRNAPKSQDKASLSTPVQDISLQNEQPANLPPELQGADESLLVAGDIITRGNLKFSNNSFVTVLATADLTASQTLTLPDASGALCLDSNNCNYTNLTQFNQLNTRVNQLGQQLGQIDITAGVVTALNNQQGAITVQGTSNQISVTTANGVVTLATPQDLASVSSPTFANMLLTGSFTVNGTINTGLNCTTFLNGGALTTNASGQIICADDETSGGGTSVITVGGTIGAIPVFVAADEIADSIISQALGTITVSGALNATGALTADSLALANALTVPNGGTGATSFTANGLLIGNGAGAVTSTNAAASGQLLLGNGTTPTFTTISGDIAFGATGITTIQADSVALGVDTTGNYLADILVGNGLSVSGGAAEGATPTVSLSLQANKGLEVDVNGLSLIDCGLNQVLKYNGSNQWACAADTDTTGSFNVAGDSGTPENVANGDTVTIQGGTNITTSVGATDTVTINTVNNPTFTTSVTTPLLQSSGALSITPGGALTVGATGQTALLQGSTTTITSNGAGNDIVLTSANQIRLTGFNCTTFTNGGVLTTDASGNISCANDDSAPANTVTGAGTANRVAMFTGAQTVADSWLLQNGSTLELDNTRNLSLNGGNFSVTGTGLFTGLITANGGISVEAGDTFTFNGDAFTDLTGTGLQISSGSLQTTLGTSVDLTNEVTGILPVTNGGTGVNGSTAANGTLLIGNGTGYTLATLTAGSGITVNNGSGSIEIVNYFGTSIETGEITDLTITGADIADDTIALGTKTTGNYVATIGGNAQVSVSGSGSESAAVTLSLVADSIGDAQLAFDTGQNLTAISSPTFNGLTLSGNLTVEGGNTTIGTAAQAGTLTLSDGSANTGAIQTAGLGQNTTFTLPDPGAASATICLNTGNCAGSGGGVTTAGGTTNRIALFNGAQTIADSWLLQNGSTLQLDNTRNLELIGGNLTLTSGNLSVTGNQTTSGSVTFSALANGFLEVNGSGLVAVGTIDLGADTAGNYVATITNGNGITGSSTTEGGTPTIALGPLTADWVQSGAFDIVLGDAGAELRILESAGATFYGTFDVGDLSQNETYTFLQGGTIVSSGNVTSFATTAVTAGNGLTGGGTTGALTLDIGAGNGITVNANDIAVIYGSAANTAVQGNTSITVSAGTNLTGGGSITLGAGGTVTLDVANSPTFSGTVTVQGSSVSIGTASTTTGSLDLYNASSTFAGSIQVANLGQATLYTLPDPGAASATICLSTGNCAGSGGGVTTAGGTTNQLAKFSGAQVIADSTISDDGTNVSTSVNLIVQGGSATIGTALQDGALTIYGNGFTAAISASLTGNQSYTLPDGTGEFCIKELGNCSGAGGGNAPNSAQYLTLALDGGLTSERTLSFNGTNFSVSDGGANGAYTVNTAQNIDTAAAPSFTGLTLTSNLNMNANTIQGTTAVIDFTNFDVAANGNVTAGTFNGQTISATASFTGTVSVAGLTTLNGGLTVEIGDTFTFNGDGFTDLTGNGLQVSTGVLTLNVQANKGLEVDGSGLSLIDCGIDDYILKYDTGAGQWYCAPDAGGTGVGDDVQVGGADATGANFLDTTASASVAGIDIILNTVPAINEISLTISDASGTLAGIVTANAQIFGGAKTFNGQIVAGAGINLGAQTLSGTTAVIDFNNFDVSSAGAITAVGVNAGSGLLQGTGGITVGGTVTFSSLTNGFLEVNGSGVVSVGTIDLGTDTAGNYVATITAGNGISGSSSTEGGTPTIALSNLTADWIQSGAFDIALAHAGSELKIMESVGNTFYAIFDAADLSADQTFVLNEGGTVVTSGNVGTYATTAVTAGNGLTGGGTTGGLTLNIGAGNGVTVNANDITLAIQANKGLEVDGNGLSLIDCVSDGYVLKYSTGTGTWGCAADAGASGTGDDISVNGTGADNANFINTTASGTVAGVTWSLNAGATPDAISVAIGNASGTEAGAVTTGAQAFAGDKTFNGQIIAGAGIDIGAQTLQGTTAIINFSNFDVDASGNTAVGGTLNVTGATTLTATLAVQGATISIGGAAQQGTLVVNDGSGQTGSLSVANLAANRTYTLPEYTTGTGTICLDSGNCSGSGGGVSTSGGTTDRIAKFTGSQAIGDSSISDNGTLVSILGSTDLSVLGGDITLGTASGAGSIVLHDGNGQTTTISAGNSVGNLAFVLPTSVGSNGQCVKNSATPGVLTFANCNNGSGAGGSITLQDAYDAGNTITATDNRNITFTFADTATDSAFLVNLQCTTCSASGGRFAVQNGGTDVFTVSPNSGGTLVKVASTTAFQVQNTSNNEVLTVNTSANEVRLGKASSVNGRLVFNNSTNGNTVAIVPATISASYTLNLPNVAAGTYDICTSSGNCVGGGGGGAPNASAYITLGNDATLSNERAIAVNSTNLTATDGGANASYTINTVQDIATTSSPQFTALTLTGDLAVNGGDITSSAGTLNINTTGTGNTTIGTGSGVTTLNGLGVALNTSLLTRLAAGTLTLNLNDAANTTFAIANTGTGVANLTVDGSSTIAGNLTVDSNTLFVDATNNRVGIGTGSPSAQLELGGSYGYGTAVNDVVKFKINGALPCGSPPATGMGSMLWTDNSDNARARINVVNNGFCGGNNTDIVFSTYDGGAGGFAERFKVNGSGANVTGDVAATGTGTFSGATVTVGAAALQGSYVIHDGDGETVSITIDDVAANSIIKIPDAVSASDTFCLFTLNNCGGTLQSAYNADADGSDAIIAMTAADGSLIFRNPSSGGSTSAYAVNIEQLATGAVGGLVVTNAGTGHSFRVNDDGTTTDTSPFIIDQLGRVGIGLASATYKLDVYDTGNQTTGSNTGSRFTLEVAPASAPGVNTSFSAASSAAVVTGANVNSDTTVTGFLGIVNSSSSGTLGSANGLYGQVFSGGSITNATGVVGRVFNTGSGTFTSAYGIQAQSPIFLSSGAITTAYGVHIGAQEVAGVGTGYGLYQAGASDDNYFAGRVGVGTPSPARALEVSAGDNVARFTSSGANSFIELKNSGSGSNISSISSTGDDLGLWTSGSKRLTIDSSGNSTFGGTLAIQGASVTVGAAALQGSYVIHDGDGETISITIDDVAANSIIKIPDTVGVNDTFCLLTLANCVTGTLQAAYNNDIDGNDAIISLTSADGGVLIRDNASPLASALFAVQNSAGTINYLGVSAGGIYTAGALQVDGDATIDGNLFVDTNTLVVDSTNDRVGIGTATPEFKLHAVSDGSATYFTGESYSASGGTIFQGRAAGGTLASPTALTSGNLIAQLGARGYDGTGFTGTRAAITLNAESNWSGTDNGTGIHFFTTTNGTTALLERMTLTDDGKLGIGATAPQSKLHVMTEGGPSFVTNTAYGGGTVYEGERANGTVGTPTALMAGDTMVQFSARGYDGAAFSSAQGAILMYAAQNWNATDKGTSLGFHTTENGTTSLTQKMTLFHNGNLGLGDISPTEGRLVVDTVAAGNTGLVVRGVAAQTGDLLQLRDNTNAVVAKFMADGTALFGSAANCGTAATLICVDESRIELKNSGGNNSTQIIQNSNGPLEFSNGPNSGTTFAGVAVKGDKTTAFQIQNGSSQSIFTADTVNSQLLTSNISPLTAASVTTNKATLIASTNDVGWYSSVKIGKDGFARIVYYDVTDGDLEYVRCTNYDCTTSTTTTIDSTGDVGDEPKMEIGTDGFARIAYVDSTNTSLKYAVCNDDSCSAPTINTVDNSATNTGTGVYLALTSTNLARMTYYQYNSTGPVGALRYAECIVDACASGTANFTNIDATNAGSYTAIVLGADGLARIAYAENNNNDLAYVRCLNSGCTSTTTPVIIDATADNTGYVYGMVLDRQGNVMIPYTDNTGLDLEFIRCNNVDCTSRSSNTLDSAGNVGSWNSVVLGHDGFARIAYYDLTNKNLKYVVCQSLDCASNSISTLEGTGVPADVGSDTAIDIRPDGRVVITHYDVGNGDLRMMQPSYSEGLTIGGASNRFARLFVADAEVTSTLRIGDTSNGINFSATNGFRLSGTARNSNIATLKPEFEGAIFSNRDPSNVALTSAIGTLNSSFCSNTGALTVNSAACATSGENHSYYEWTHNETSAQEYYIYVRWRVPDNFDSAEAFSNHVAIRGFSSKSAANANNTVTLALYNDRGAQCGSTTSITNGTANQWGSGVLLSSLSGDGDCEDIDAGEYVTFAIRMKANSTGTTGEIIRMGEIEISYKSTY